MKGDKTLPVSNQSGVESVKQEYVNAIGATPDEIPTSSLRFFCMGKELKDDLFLYSYDINDDIVIQAMIKK